MNTRTKLPPAPIRTPVTDGKGIMSHPWSAWMNLVQQVGTAAADSTGPAGIQGVTGLAGIGMPGIQGVTGIAGTEGIPGIQGDTGVFGEDLVADIIPLGLPTDGSFASGFFPFNGSTITTDSIDELNAIIGAIAPAPPSNLSGAMTLSGTTKYNAILPTGLSASWYQDGKVAGSTISDYVIDPTYAMASPSQSTEFKSGTLTGGDVGTLKNLINGVTDSIRQLADGTGTTGNLQVTDLSVYNSIWRKANAQINYDQTTEGFLRHSMLYAVTGNPDQSTSDTKIWYDDSNGLPFYNLTSEATQHTLFSTRYLSGIRYYYVGDTFDMTASIARIAEKAIRPTNPITYSMPGLNTVTHAISGASFNWDQVYNLNDTAVALNAANVYNINARLTTVATKPSGLSSTSTQSTTNALVNTYPTNYSTNCNIYMVDEYYRMPLSVDFSIVLPITGLWTSSDPLANGNAQLYNNGWAYPQINFESGYLPAQQSGTNYSGFTGVQSVVWGCNIGVAHSSMTVIFTGMNYTSISPYGTGDLNMEIRLPTETTWMDCGKSFGDGNGCRNDLGSSGSTLALTFGTHSSTGSTGVVYIAIFVRTTSAATASKLTVAGT